MVYLFIYWLSLLLNKFQYQDQCITISLPLSSETLLCTVAMHIASGVLTFSWRNSAWLLELCVAVVVLAKKRETCLLEMKRLREGNGCMLPYPGLLGSLLAADMRLPLKPEFMAKLGTVHGRLVLYLFSWPLYAYLRNIFYNLFSKLHNISYFEVNQVSL